MTAPRAIHLDAGGRPRCGHPHAFCLHADEANVTCGMCLGLIAGTHHLGIRWADPKPCGTTAAYRRHLRHHERACRYCLQAEADRWAERAGSAA